MKKSGFPTIKRKTEDLIPYARNSRTHSAEQVNQIASSIKEFGFTNPIIIKATMAGDTYEDVAKARGVNASST